MPWQNIIFDGQTRRYFIENPSGANSQTPILVCLHGGGGDPTGFDNSADWRGAANLYHLRVILPEGYEQPNNGGHTWNVGDGQGAAEAAGADSVGFVDAVLAANISGTQPAVYIVGMSKGAMLAAKLANESQWEISGVGMVAGVLVDQSDTTLTGVKVVHLHGTGDTNVPIGGGNGRPAALSGFEELIDDNGPIHRAEVTVSDGTIYTYADASDVTWGVFYEVNGGPHNWNVSGQVTERDFILNNLL